MKLIQVFDNSGSVKATRAMLVNPAHVISIEQGYTMDDNNFQSVIPDRSYVSIADGRMLTVKGSPAELVKLFASK